MKKGDKTHYKNESERERERECCSTIHLAASGLGPVHCPQCGEGERRRGGGMGGGDGECLQQVLGIRINSFSESDPVTLIHI